MWRTACGFGLHKLIHSSTPQLASHHPSPPTCSRFAGWARRCLLAALWANCPGCSAIPSHPPRSPPPRRRPARPRCLQARQPPRGSRPPPTNRRLPPHPPPHRHPPALAQAARGSHPTALPARYKPLQLERQWWQGKRIQACGMQTASARMLAAGTPRPPRRRGTMQEPRAAKPSDTAAQLHPGDHLPSCRAQLCTSPPLSSSE